MGSATDSHAANEAALFDIVVCQADKQVVCGGMSNSSSSMEMHCNQTKEVVPVAVCNFSVGLWNLGGTCINNHLDGLQFPNCPDGPRAKAISSIQNNCRNATQVDQRVCHANPESKDCKIAEVERLSCMRLAMSY